MVLEGNPATVTSVKEAVKQEPPIPVILFEGTGGVTEILINAKRYVVILIINLNKQAHIYVCVCVCVCVCMYIYIHTYIYTHTHIYIYVYIYIK